MPTVVDIDAGGAHTCAIKGNGTVWCWGRGTVGQLGDGTTGDANGRRLTAVRAESAAGPLGDIIAITTGDTHTCAAAAGGQTWCWGLDQYGQIGDGVAVNATDPRVLAVRVLTADGTFADATDIGSGKGHTCAGQVDGSVWCWGLASDGQVGDDTLGDDAGLRLLPVRVLQGSGPLGGARDVVGGQVHSCAVKADGSAWCWGLGASGQLGDGTTGSSMVAVKVGFS